MASRATDASPWRSEPAPRAWRAYVLGLTLASLPFFVRGFAALPEAPVEWGFLLALFAVLVFGNAGILELPPYRFLHMTTGMIVFGGFFIAGPSVLALLALSLKPSELLMTRLRRLVDPDRSPPLGGLPSEYVVPTVSVGVVLGIVDSLRHAIGLAYPFSPADSGGEVHLFLILAPIYVAFVFLTELGIVLRVGWARAFGTRRARGDLVVYLLGVLLGAHVVSGIARFYGPDLVHSLFALGWMLWGFGVFGVAQILVRRSLMIERLVSARRRQERLAALGRLASVIAHQTRHHLGVLNMSAYVLGETLARENLSATAREAVASELAAIARTRDELDALLAQELRGGTHEESFGLLALARECGRDLEPLAENRAVALTYGGEEQLIYGDRLRLKQAISNVIRNAIEATPQGSRVAIELGGEDSSIRLTVCDQGPGLSPSARGHLFEPLFSEKSDGLGMGLYVARTIVEAHGGKIVLSSTDRGTQAEISLGGAG